MSFVIDASLVLAWSFEDERTPAVMAALRRVEAESAEAPSLWPLEIVNSLTVAVRRQRITLQERDDMLAHLAGLPVALDPTTPERIFGPVAAVCDRFRLTAYDAAYLELAERRDLPLATLDRALRSAAIAAGRPVFPA